MQCFHIYAYFYTMYACTASVLGNIIIDHSTTEFRMFTNVNQITDSDAELLDGFTTRRPFQNIPVDVLQASNSLVQLYQGNTTYIHMFGNISEICPGWLPCGIVLGSEPCCLTCYCDDECGKSKPCCPGFQNNKTKNTARSNQFENFQKICVESAFFTNITKVKYAAIDYEMIVNCPDGTPYAIKEKCMAMFREKEAGYIHAFVDILPVTHKESLTNFANKHCAACHGLSPDDYQNWGARAVCGDEIMYDSESIERYIQQNEYCHLRIIPPFNEIGYASQCFTDMTPQCNITGLWEVYDPKIETLCMEIDWLYRPPISDFITLKRYRNIFCAICNGEAYIAKENRSVCPVDIKDDFNFDFAVVINYDGAFQEPTGRTPNSKINMCPLGWMVDPLSMSCQEVVCSFPEILNKFTMACEDRFEQIRFGSVEIPFRIPLNSSQIFSLTDLPQAHEHFKQALEPLRKDFSCNYHSIFYKTNTSYDSLDGENYVTGSNVDVTSVILLAYADLDVPFSRTFEEILEEYMNSTLHVNGRSLKLEYNTVEATYLPTATNFTLPNRTIVLGDPLLRTEIFSMYRDRFDGMTVLKVGESFIVNPCASNNLLYKKSYYDCPAFVYEMKSHAINYTTTGIVLSRVNVELKYGEFRSLNNSHVAVCLKTFEDKGLSIKNKLGNSGRAKEVYSPILFILVTLLKATTYFH